MHNKHLKSKKIYSISLFDNPKMPARSRLPQLQAIGRDTAMMESLTSYITRQANKLSVSLMGFIRKGFETELTDGNLKMNFWFNDCSPLINGVGTAAETFVKLTEDSTLLQNMRYHTLLPFRNVLPVQGLIRKRIAWCPKCFKDWKSNGLEIYIPLLWLIKEVKICIVHDTYLYEWCPCCRRKITVLPRRPVPGYCPYCDGFLGKENTSIKQAEKDKESEKDHWIARQFADLIATVKNNEPLYKKTNIADFLQKYVKKKFGGKNKAFARHFQIANISARNWVFGETRPVLKELLRFCYNAEITPNDLFTGKLDLIDSLPVKTAKLKRTILKRSHKRIAKMDKNIIKKQMLRRLKSSRKKPYTLTEIASELNYSVTTLRRYFPKLSKKIGNNFRENLRQEANIRLDEKRKKIRSEIKKALDLGIYPSRSVLRTKLDPNIICNKIFLTNEIAKIMK